MKKKTMKVALCLAMAGILTSSCVGSFAMFNKLASWNKTATDNKFLNELIFIVISPAYAFAGLADALVLNSLEFWTGDNPMARRVGKTVNVQGEDGLIYAVKTLKKGYEITDPQGKVYYVTYNKKDNSWSMETEGQERESFRFNEDGTIQANMPNGERMNFTLDAAGVMQARMAVDGSCYALK